jgi:hypothetical protein
LQQQLSETKLKQIFSPNINITISSSDNNQTKEMKMLAQLLQDINQSTNHSFSFEQIKEKILLQIDVVIRELSKKRTTTILFFQRSAKR